jgi:replicative DNA helicase
MSKIDKQNLGFLGLDYEIRLIAQFLTDRKFANNIMDIINPNYFSDEKLRLIVREIKDAFEVHQVIPDIDSLQARLMLSCDNVYTKEFLITQLNLIKDVNLNDTIWVQETAMKFCKQQELKKSLALMQNIVEKGDLNAYDDCHEILQKSLSIGNNKDDGEDVCVGVEKALADDFRKPIPTGIIGLDEIMNGGLSKGELGIILAPFGVGKTTIITKIANSAKNLGYNVIQIFFEDKVDIIKRKHYSCWSGIELNDLSNHKEELVNLIEEKSNSGGKLHLKRFPSDGTTIPIIRNYVRKLISSGFNPDLILLDYIDCVEPSKKVDDVNVGEGNVMRQFETMLNELDLAGWTAIQGNRGSIKSVVVDSDQMGGSIKKGQIGHFLMSIARSFEQKALKLATLAILKSRFGDDGIVLEDCIFNNATMDIVVTDQNGGKSFLQTKEEKEIKNQERIKMALEKAQALKRLNS